MCKILSVPKVNDANRDAAWLFVMKLGEVISRFNNDGLGYAAFDKQGKLFGERWLFNHMAFTDFAKDKGYTAEQADKVYNFFGDKVVRDEAQAIILHTRMATCEKGINNTHPFVNDKDNPEIAMIHNGIISNHRRLLKKYSSCDSEVIVHLFDQENVKENLDNMANVTRQIDGWYTTLSLLKDSNGIMVMDALSDSQRLSSYFIKELDTRVYSTDPRDIIEVVRHFNFTASGFMVIKSNTAVRINAVTGEIMSEVKAPEMERKYVNYGWPEAALEKDADKSFADRWFRRNTH